jgi:diguanylate cyclase (GGDEF)-like protein/hemerythrin-like metal-binding protein/PAS domain S-box-containing protein
MSGAVAHLQTFIGSLFSGLAAKRGLLILVLLVQGVCAAGFLYLEHNWIEAGVVQSLKNVSSMHRRSFGLLETTLNYQLASIGEAVQAMGDSRSDQRLHALLAKEVQNAWLDTIVVLDAAGMIVAIDTDVPLESVLLSGVLEKRSFKDLPNYQAAVAGGAEFVTFAAPRPHAPELGGGGISMFRMIRSADGQLLGTVVGFTSLHSLSALLNYDTARGFDLGQNGVLGFLDQHTHEWLYRYAHGMSTVVEGDKVISPSLFQDTRYGPDVKFYQSPIDGLERLAVVDPHHQEQWLQVVAASKDDYLFNWRIQVTFSVFAFAGLCALQWLLAGFVRQKYQQRMLLNLVLDTVDAYVYFKSSDRRFHYVNAKTAALFGLPAEQIAGRLDSELMPKDFADAYWAMDQKVFASGKKQSGEEVLRISEDETRYYASIKVPVHLPGQPPALIGFSTDVTELHEQTVAREAAEKALAAHNHYLWLNNQVLEKLGQNASLSEVLNTMLRIIDDYRPGMLGTVFLLADNGKALVGCAAPNLPQAWLSATAWISIEDMSGSAATAVHRRETVIVEDIASHPYWAAPDFAAIRDTALGFGLRAAWSQPIKSSEGKILGVFNLYQREPAAPDADDLVLLADYAKLAQMVIERARLAEALRESQALYRLIAENSNDVIWVMQYPDLTYSYMSPSIAWLHGWTPEEFAGQPPDELMSAGVLRQWHDMLEEHVRRIGEGDLTGCFIECELEVRNKDGHRVQVEVVANIMLDSSSRPTHIVGSSRDITRRKAAEDSIRKMAFFDQLTGLPNRRMMEDRLAQMLTLAKREQRAMSLLFVDLDRFKAVNDQHGHAAGDWLLTQVASRMNSVLRTSDTAARIGGDEFVILLPDSRKTEDAVQVAEKIRCALEQPFVMDNGVELDISSSIGVVMYPDQADNVRDLLHFGDEAMYRAKKGGRNAVEVFDALAQPGGQNMVHLQWRDEYASGYDDIDNEHQELFRLANDLFRLFTGPAHQHCDAGQMQALDRLLEHVRYHFAHEEQILAACDHEALAVHNVQHATILEQAQRLQGQAESGEVTLGELVQFVVVEIIGEHFSTEIRKPCPVDFQI